MFRRKNLSGEQRGSKAALCLLLLALVLPAAAQQPTTGGLRGRVKVGAGNPSDIVVTVRQGDREVKTGRTNAKGEFEVGGLAPGHYGLTFRKRGLQVGRMENVEVRAGKSVSLKDKLFLPVDEGAIAFIRGSVFDAAGRGFAGARVELELVGDDGSFKKLDSRVTNGLGQFGFRMTPETARYRLTAKADGMRTATEEVTVDSAAIFRVALSLTPDK
jgi:Carboxypeptidase regulatory-like domain